MSEVATSEVGTQSIAPRQNRLVGLWRRFRRNRLAIFGLVIVVLMILTAIFARLAGIEQLHSRFWIATAVSFAGVVLVAVGVIGSGPCAGSSTELIR